jgi:hypothetical protein
LCRIRAQWRGIRPPASVTESEIRFGISAPFSGPAKKIAELNTSLILERRVNKQLGESLRDAVPNLIESPNLTMSAQPAHEPSMLSG